MCISFIVMMIISSDTSSSMFVMLVVYARFVSISEMAFDKQKNFAKLYSTITQLLVLQVDEFFQEGQKSKADSSIGVFIVANFD